jgi:hypothetical protein
MTAFSISAVSPGASTDPAFGAESTGARHHDQAPTNIIGGQQDTAILSPAARALQLFQQGESVAAVAITISATPATVDGYLHIPTQSTSVPIAAATVAGG